MTRLLDDHGAPPINPPVRYGVVPLKQDVIPVNAHETRNRRPRFQYLNVSNGLVSVRIQWIVPAYPTVAMAAFTRAKFTVFGMISRIREGRIGLQLAASRKLPLLPPV